MRSVIIHLAAPATQADVADVLDGEYVGSERKHWVAEVEGDACLYIAFYTDHLVEFEPEDLALLRARFAREIPLSVIADVSGRHDGTAQVIRFVTMMLARFPGVASDDYSEHLWTRDEVAQGARFDGLTFFDYRGYHARHYSGARKKE